MKMKLIFFPHPWGASDGPAMVVYNYKQFDAVIPKYSASPPPLNGVLEDLSETPEDKSESP